MTEQSAPSHPFVSGVYCDPLIQSPALMAGRSLMTSIDIAVSMDFALGAKPDPAEYIRRKILITQVIAAQALAGSLGVTRKLPTEMAHEFLRDLQVLMDRYERRLAQAQPAEAAP